MNKHPGQEPEVVLAQRFAAACDYLVSEENQLHHVMIVPASPDAPVAVVSEDEGAVEYMTEPFELERPHSDFRICAFELKDGRIVEVAKNMSAFSENPEDIEGSTDLDQGIVEPVYDVAVISRQGYEPRKIVLANETAYQLLDDGTFVVSSGFIREHWADSSVLHDTYLSILIRMGLVHHRRWRDFSTTDYEALLSSMDDNERAQLSEMYQAALTDEHLPRPQPEMPGEIESIVRLLGSITLEQQIG